VSLWTLDCHKPVIPVVTFLTPLPWHAQGAKDRWATVSGRSPLLEGIVKVTFPLVVYGRFLSRLSYP